MNSYASNTMLQTTPSHWNPTPSHCTIALEPNTITLKPNMAAFYFIYFSTLSIRNSLHLYVFKFLIAPLANERS